MSRVSSWFSRHPFALFATLYLAIGGLALGADAVIPEVLRNAARSLMNGEGLGIADPGSFGRTASRDVPAGPLWALATVAMMSAGALSLPVAWLYTITRQKRGYRQSVVQTLILLPVVVAGVVILVKFSLALAFSLAGIVAAVRFRNTLEDSKDAVFIFVATGIGLAAGVELSAAATLSFVFNLATLLLFVSDFGRTPARLEGEIAEERMQRALSVANRTSQFVARIDTEILEDMAPAQLEALAERAWQRRRDADEGDRQGEPGPKLDVTLRVHAYNVDAARVSVEAVLSRDAKRWQFRSIDAGADGLQAISYSVRMRKRVSPAALLQALRADRMAVIEVELE